MSLDPSLSIAEDLFVFSCTVRVCLFELDVAETDGGSDTASHYFRTYGVTERSYSAAAALVEGLRGQLPGQPIDPDGWIDEIELALVNPAMGRDRSHDILPMTSRGVHFVSGKIFFFDDGTEN